MHKNLAVGPKPNRTTQAEQDPSNAGRTTTRSTSGAEPGTLGTKGRKTTLTLKDSRANINTLAKAKGWLTKEELLVEGEEITPAALSQALMWLAAGDKSTVEQLVDGIRAIALCIDGWEGDKVIEVAKTELQNTSAKWVEEAKQELRKVADGVMEEAKKSRAGDEDRNAGESWADDGDGKDMQRRTINDIAKAIPSYAQVIASEWRKDADRKEERVHQDYMAKEAIRRRKVLIDGIEGVKSAAGGLSPKELVEKVNIALAAARELTDGNGAEPSRDPRAVAAKVLENGGVVIEMESEDVVEWVRTEDVKVAFEENFGGSAKIKDQLFQVVINFLPVTLRDTLESSTHKIETDNDLLPDTIAKCKWLKSPKFWSKGQRFAHALVAVKGRLEASLLIQQGVIVEGQRFKVRKLMEEPKRCFKCQQLGHMATGCKEIHEICSNCAGAHAGSECDKTPDKYKCINCLKAKRPSNHASWDRECPSMSEEKKKKAERDPDSKYRFFPTEEDWTWERKDRPGPGPGAAAEVVTIQEEATRYNGGTEHRWDWNGTADGGWDEMRAKRALGEVIGGAEGWRKVGAKGKSANKEKASGRVLTQASQTQPQASSTRRPATQSGSRSKDSRDDSTTRQEGRSGRQSVLGDYWGDTDQGEVIEQQREPSTDIYLC